MIISATTIALYDLWAKVRKQETITCGLRRIKDNPVGFLLLAGVAGVGLAHVFGESR